MKGVNVEIDPKFKRVIQRFSVEEKQLTSNTLRGLFYLAQRMAKMEAQKNLAEEVYTAAYPPSLYGKTNGTKNHPSYGGNIAKYMAERRLGTAYRAITMDPIYGAGQGTTGVVRVDIHDPAFKEIYYPGVLDAGARPKIDYRPRPYWTRMVAMMRAEYPAMAKKAQAELAAKLGGTMSANAGMFVVIEEGKAE